LGVGRFFAGLSSSSEISTKSDDVADRSDGVRDLLCEWVETADGAGEAVLGVARVLGCAGAADEAVTGFAGFC
jgi:hypothetical protein